jgi:hypothetical protein
MQEQLPRRESMNRFEGSKMALKKDKAKVVDEVWTQDRVKEFLVMEPAENVEKDFHMLLKAYQSMRVDNFADFVGYFVEEGRDVNSKGPSGETVLSIVKEHRNSGEFVEVLVGTGAA